MMHISDLPIRTKLLGLIMLGSVVTLVLALLAILIYDSFDYKQRRIADLRTQAEILGRTGNAALVFNDASAAKEYLNALDAKPDVVAGAFYASNGTIFARYERTPGENQFPQMEKTGFHIEDDHVNLFHAIEQNGSLVGVVYLRASLNRFSRLLQFSSIAVMAAVVSLFIGLWVSSRMQHVVSTPILEISSIANAVIERKNYTLRAKKTGNDEIGKLTDAFNAMLARIEERDEKLLEINQSLAEEVAERRRAQAALHRNMRELERSNAELEQFAYVSSHDLQEPLRMVASYTQLLEKRYKDSFDEKGLTFLHYIVDGAKRMQELIDDLLTFSRVGTRGRELQPISIEAPLKTALLNLKASIEEKHVEIHWGELPQVMGDSSQLTQLFQNLISNAIKFCDGRQPIIEINVSTQNDHWLFAVKDNGIGIDKEHFDRIFVIFQRLHGRTEYPGSGIGLAICKKIVERHGGNIWVASEKGKGTTFYFTLRKVI